MDKSLIVALFIYLDDESQVGEDNHIDLEAFQRRHLLDSDEDNDWNITC